MRRRALLVAGLIAAAGAPLGCRKRSRPPRFPDTAPPGEGGLHFLYEIDFARAWEPGRGREGALAQTVEVLRRRVASLTSAGVVRPPESGSGVEVFLPGGPAAMYEAFRVIARQPGRFQIQVVDDGSPFMAAMARRVRDQDVDVKEDRWTSPGGGDEHRDVFLHAYARSRQRLVDLLARDAASNPLPPDREIRLDNFDGENPGARSYYLIKSGGIDNTDIADAEVGKGWDGGPEVQIVLTPQGRQKFADLTARSVGRKIVVVVDGTIETAPVVMSRIPGGRVHITTQHDSSRDAAAVSEDLEDLVAVLRSGPLPAPLMLMVEDRVPRLP